MNKYVIYTAIVGNYDEILQPVVVDDRFDYILFSNDIKKPNIGVWQIRPIYYHNAIQTKIARWVKTHPEELLPEYVSSVWMDANIVIQDNSFYSRIIEMYDTDVFIASMPHLYRHCIYNEMIIVLKLKLETEDIILRWGRTLRKNKYPRNNGLHETGVLYRKHSEEKVVQFDKRWWNYIYDYSRRDQLSFDYALWEQNLPCEYFLSDNENVWNSQIITIIQAEHKNVANRNLNFTWKETLLMRYCHHYSNEIVNKAYYFVYGTLFPRLTAKLLGLCFCLRDKVKSHI